MRKELGITEDVEECVALAVGFILVFSYVSLEDAFLDEILRALVCEVDAERFKGVGAASDVTVAHGDQ